MIRMGAAPKPRGPGLAWNISPNFRELKKARYQIGDRLMNIMIASFDPGHITTPANLGMNLHAISSRMDFHATMPLIIRKCAIARAGTGTLSLRAGNKLDGKSPSWASFTSGDHHQSRVICEVVALPSPRLRQ
jgi:hypothetical protein